MRSKSIKFYIYCKAVLAFLLAFASARFACGADAAALWSGKVQPIFDANCVKCHGLMQQKSGLELDSPETVMKGGHEGAVVVPGKPALSRLYHMGRPKRENQEERRKQNGWWSFLENSFRTNRPWNETVRDILIARPDKPENKGASWFLYERRNEHQAIAEAVAPVVYGTKIDCAQCHDHPLAREIKQAHYWGLVAAFNRSKNVEGGSAVAESAVGGFVNFTNLKKESQPAVIALLTGRTIEEVRPSGDQKENDSDDNYVDPKAKARVPKFSRREAFADAVTRDNPLLARAFVNRM